MRRADRLFDIVQVLRRSKLVRARDLAEKFEVSERTIYRDIQGLIAAGVPVDGEAGVGYILRSGFDLPPLMFTEPELEALALGARIVQSWTDAQLAEAAGNVLAKIEAVLPERLRLYMEATPIDVPGSHWAEPVAIDMAALRRAVRSRLKLAFAYKDAAGEETRRTVRPLLVSFFGPVWTMTAWCELRQDFRTFRLDRIADMSVTSETFRPEPGRNLADFLQRMG